jgi:hypothetical protein
MAAYPTQHFRPRHEHVRKRDTRRISFLNPHDHSGGFSFPLFKGWEDGKPDARHPEHKTSSTHQDRLTGKTLHSIIQNMSAEKITAWVEKHRKEIENDLFFFAFLLWMVILLMAELELTKKLWWAVASPEAIKTSGMHMR